MPNTKSAIKAARQNPKKRKINLVALNKIRKAIKELKKMSSAGKTAETAKALEKVFSALDKAAKKNVIHKNKANRSKSRLSKFVAKAVKK